MILLDTENLLKFVEHWLEALPLGLSQLCVLALLRTLIMTTVFVLKEFVIKKNLLL